MTLDAAPVAKFKIISEAVPKEIDRGIAYRKGDLNRGTG
jgi:hypothetical protein